MNIIDQQIQEIIRQQKALQISLDHCVRELSEKGPAVSETKRQDLFKVISQAELNGLAINDHYMATYDNDLKDQYACLLITLLKEISVVLSEEQYVLLRLLLQSMKLSNEISHYFEGNTVIDDQFLLDFKVKIEGKEAAQSLMADLMIIARINSIFDQQVLQTLSELMSFFEIKESQVKEIDSWSAYLLNIDTDLTFKKIELRRMLHNPINGEIEYKVSNFCIGLVNKREKILTLQRTLIEKPLSFARASTKSIVKTTSLSELNILSDENGYFVLAIDNEVFLANGEILLGYLFQPIQYLMFWYSFIDLEKVIKENK